ETRAFERIEHVRVRLCYIETGIHAIAHHDKDTKPRRLGARRHTKRGSKICWSIPTEVARRAHRSREHDGLVAFEGARHEVCGFFERVSTVSDNDARYITPLHMFCDNVAQFPHPLDCHVRTRECAEVFDL